MAVPLVLALIGNTVARKYATDLAIAGVGALSAYFGVKSLQSAVDSFGSAPSGNNPTTPDVLKKDPALPTTAPTAPTAPTVPNTKPVAPFVPALTPTLDAYQDSLGRSLTYGEDVSSAFADALSQSEAEKADALELAGASPFLLNMAKSTAATSDISFAINAQSAVLATLNETLERNLSLIAGVAVTSLQNTYEQAVENTAALVTITDRLKPFEDNQVYEQTSTVVKDVNGAEVATAAPRAIALAKNAALAKGEADTNSLGGELISEIEDLFSDMDISADKFFNYVKVSDMIAQMTPEEASGIDNFSAWLEGHFK